MAMHLCWKSGSPVAELCLMGVREISHSRVCQGLERARGPLFRVVYEPIGVLNVFDVRIGKHTNRLQVIK